MVSSVCSSSLASTSENVSDHRTHTYTIHIVTVLFLYANATLSCIVRLRSSQVTKFLSEIGNYFLHRVPFLPEYPSDDEYPDASVTSPCQEVSGSSLRFRCVSDNG